MNDNCICKGFYVAAQDLPWFDDDRFRIHHYNVHVRMGTDGSRVAMYNSTLGNPLDHPCDTVCPLAWSVVSTA